MTRILLRSSSVLVLVVSAAALSRSRPNDSALNLPATPYRYTAVKLPAHFTQPGRNHDNTPPDNPLTDDGATLGRVLFYDTRLSANNTTSCGSCHVQAHGFADPRPASKGFHGAPTDRRAMPLVNVRYYERARFFWDERAGGLEDMVVLPIQSRIEMGQDLKQVADLLTRDAAYPELFARAFGDRQVTEQRIGKALAQFVRSIVSYQSRYDEGRARAHSAQDDFDNFTRQENRGKALFMRNCSTCHMEDGNEHFFVPAPANNGLRGSDPAADGGAGDVSLRAADLGSFKSPSLRNVEVTAPYGHDGRFKTLDRLIDHYSDNAIFDPNRGYHTPAPLKFTASEKVALIAFLKTLTDNMCLTDPKFSNPFVNRKDTARSVEPTTLTAGAMLMGLGAAAGPAAAVLRSAVLGSEVPPLPLMPRDKSNDAVTERLFSFDVNADQRISRNELPERMQALVARGDANVDGALDANEVRHLLNGLSPVRTTRVAPNRRAAEGLPGVITDLKLPPATHARALAIVRAHRLCRDINGPAAGVLCTEMRALLGREEYENFVAAAIRLSKTEGFVK